MTITITGSQIQAYLVCPRQLWLLSHQITGNQYNEFLAIGRLYSQETFKREKKELVIDGNKLDIVRGIDGTLTIIEVKKSSKMIRAAKMQLLHYLFVVSKKGHKVTGEIRIPKEKKVIPVTFGKKEQEEIKALHEQIYMLTEQEFPPLPQRISACRKCSYSEFCWS